MGPQGHSVEPTGGIFPIPPWVGGMSEATKLCRHGTIWEIRTGVLHRIWCGSWQGNPTHSMSTFIGAAFQLDATFYVGGDGYTAPNRWTWVESLCGVTGNIARLCVPIIEKIVHPSLS